MRWERYLLIGIFVFAFLTPRLVYGRQMVRCAHSEFSLQLIMGEQYHWLTLKDTQGKSWVYGKVTVMTLKNGWVSYFRDQKPQFASLTFSEKILGEPVKEFEGLFSGRSKTSTWIKKKIRCRSILFRNAND